MEYLVQKSSLASVADKIREVTNTSEELNFPDGWKAALDGVGGGGGDSSGSLKTASGTWTPDADTNRMIIELDFIPFAMYFHVDDFANKGLDGTSKVLGGSYFNGIGFLSRTNAAGTGKSIDGNLDPDTTMIESDSSTIMLMPRPRAAGGFFAYSNFQFRAGYAYKWEAMGE